MSYRSSSWQGLVNVGLDLLESRVVFSFAPAEIYVDQHYTLEATAYVRIDGDWVPLGGATIRFTVNIGGAMYEVATKTTNSSGYAWVSQYQSGPMTLSYTITLLASETYFGNGDGGYVTILAGEPPTNGNGEEPPTNGNGEPPVSSAAILLVGFAGLGALYLYRTGRLGKRPPSV